MELVYYKKIVPRQTPEDCILKRPALCRLHAIAEPQRQLPHKPCARPAAAHAQIHRAPVVVEPLKLHQRGGLADLARPVDERRHAVVERRRASLEHRLLDLCLDDADVLLLHLLKLDGLERPDRLDDVRPARILAVLLDAIRAAEHLIERVLVVRAHLRRKIRLLEVVFLRVGVQPEHLLAVLLAQLPARNRLRDRRADLMRRHRDAALDYRAVPLARSRFDCGCY